MTHSIKKIRTQLKQIADQEVGTIRAAVATEALNYDNPVAFFSDLAQYGCVNGMVTSLIYYRDTHAFFDTHYDEIEEIRTSFEADTGQAITTDHDLKNHFAWFAFEEIAYQISNDLGLDI